MKNCIAMIAAGMMFASAGFVGAATEIDFMFPAPVQGKLTMEMTSIIGEYNKSQSEVKVRGIFTGDYDTTKMKAEAAAKAGNPPALVIMMANLTTDLAINGQLLPIQDITKYGNVDAKQFLDDNYWPALHKNAMYENQVYAIPFQNSTPVLYYNKTLFEQHGIKTAPQDWNEIVDVAKKLTNRQDDQWGIMLPSVNTDYCGWILSSLVMANGGKYYNTDYPGEVYYTAPSTVGAMTFWRDLAHKHQVMPTGVLQPNAITSSFFAGKLGMAFLSTGALGHIRSNVKDFELGVAFMPSHVKRGVIIGGASLVSFKGINEEQKEAAWKFMEFLTSPETSSRWSRFTGYFAPRKQAYEMPEMKEYLAKDDNASVALSQLQYANPWYSTYETVAVRKAMENQMAALLNDAHLTPLQAAETAQKEADALLAPYVAKTTLALP
jgi:sn-glycerol 3-phosphate transport system substrate-binding protein